MPVTISRFPLFPARSAVLGLAMAAGLATFAAAGEITVFAAASLNSVLARVAERFKAAHGHSVTLSAAGSSVLARQIELGAPANVFISANTLWMDHLEANGLVVPGTRTELLSNRLVLVAHGRDADAVPLGPALDLAGLVGQSRLAMALVEAVPAGIYGKAALENLGLWESVSPLVAQSDNVRAALALVALGEAQFGIVYATDARDEPEVTAVAVFPPESHPPIHYPAAIIAGQDSPAARQFLAFLQGPDAAGMFRDAGFTMIEE